MAELVHEFAERLVDDGRAFAVRVRGAPRADGFWEGWLEFVAPDGAVRRTAHDTLQRRRSDLAYWASGLEAVYLEGAFERARAARAGGRAEGAEHPTGGATTRVGG